MIVVMRRMIAIITPARGIVIMVVVISYWAALVMQRMLR